MSLEPFNFMAKSVRDLQSFFQSVVDHLDARNYDNSSLWVPVITNLTGSPSITSFYQRFGKRMDFTVLIDGDSITSSSVIDNLPIAVIGYGIVRIFNQTDNVLIGHSYIDIDTTDCYLPDWSLTGKKVIIQGSYQISGI